MCLIKNRSFEPFVLLGIFFFFQNADSQLVSEFLFIYLFYIFIHLFYLSIFELQRGLGPRAVGGSWTVFGFTPLILAIIVSGICG